MLYNIFIMAFKNNKLFDYLNNILKNKSEKIYIQHISDSDFQTSFSKFMILRYLSMCRDYRVQKIVLKNFVLLEHVDNKILYKYLIENIPAQNNSFIKYIK